MNFANLYIYLIEITLSSLTIYVLWSYYHDFKLILAFLICFVIYQLGNYFITFSNCKKINHFVMHLSEEIDEMQNGQFEINYTNQTETIESFLDYKLQQLYEAINSQKDKTRVEKENLQEVISHISHQIKTPITNISIIGETFDKGIDNPKEYQTLTNILNQQIKKAGFPNSGFC